MPTALTSTVGRRWKTTMVNLLMRFYDVNGGGIRIDGIDTREMSRQEVRAIFGMAV